MIRRSRVVIVICPHLEETVRGDRPRRADGADRERPGSGRHAARRVRARACGRALGLAADTPIVLYTGTFEAYQGLDLLFAAAARWSLAARPDARFVLVGGRPEQVEQAKRAGARAGRGWQRRVHRAAAGRGDSGISRRRRRARLAAQPRHEHAAQDLSVPAIGPADRRHAAADAHAGARRRGGVPDGGDAGGLRRGDPRGARRSAPARSEVGARARRLAETKYSYEAYLEPDASGVRATAPAGSRPGSRGDVA